MNDTADIQQRSLALLKRYWGYDSFRPMQQEIITSTMQGFDTLGLLPTGGGKSITFQIPALASDGLTVVVTPLISLMKDQVDNLRERGIMAGQLNHAMRKSESELVLTRCKLGKIKILYLSPEKLRSPSLEAWWNVLNVTLIVVDEAHCISQWGYDFRPSYLLIGKLREQFPKASVLALTASATPEVVQDIMAKLSFRTTDHCYRLSFTRKNISYIVRHCDFKDAELLHILSRIGGSGIVYTRSRKRTHELAAFLMSNNISADFYHAGLAPEDKNEKQNRWKSGETRVMVATNAFGMGIDKPDVRFVIHHDLPSSLEEYYQEAGRAGRDGLPSWAVILAAKSDKGLLTRRLSESFPDKEVIREVYDQLMVFLNIAMGEGYERLIEFPFAKFCDRWSLQPTIANNALKILSQSGYFDYIEEMTTRSRILMTMQRRELYDLQLTIKQELVLQYILRNYTGIFADYEFIDEIQMSAALIMEEREIVENLISLRKQHVIDYVPRKRSPYIFMLRSREYKSDILLPKTVYEQRRKQLEQRLAAMKSFVFDDYKCRVQTMLGYFGEKVEPCTTCDVCRERRKREANRKPQVASSVLAEAVLFTIANNPEGISLYNVAMQLGIAPNDLFATIRDLLDTAQITLSNNLLFPSTTSKSTTTPNATE
jgi:ATP-dependent DNA helicase RecQ